MLDKPSWFAAKVQGNEDDDHYANGQDMLNAMDKVQICMVAPYFHALGSFYCIVRTY
jgi:hypothetical protein